MKNKVMHLGVLILIVVLVMGVVGISTLNYSNENSIGDYTYYKQIEIKAGDTLWSIAGEHKNETARIQPYIKEIKRFNDLRSDTIHAGDFIFVPVAK